MRDKGQHPGETFVLRRFIIHLVRPARRYGETSWGLFSSHDLIP